MVFIVASPVSGSMRGRKKKREEVLVLVELFNVCQSYILRKEIFVKSAFKIMPLNCLL